MKVNAWAVLAVVGLTCGASQQALAQDAPEPVESQPTAAEAPPAAEVQAAAEAPPAAETPPAETADPASDADLAAELAKLGLDTAEGGAVDTSFHLSGFADFSVIAVVGSDTQWRGAYQRFPAFSVGNFNVYLDKRLVETLRMFGEVRFTFLPNGTVGPGSLPGEYQSTETEDYANFKRPIRWAGIYVPRVYLEYSPYRFLGVRVGVFLTPYGIWNVDHGSPTIIPVQRPFVVGQALFPERQTGIEAFGQFDLGSHSTLGYHLTVSNGLGPVSEYNDFDANKALGARVFWLFDGFGELRLGGSAFYGTDTTAHEVAGLADDGEHVEFEQEIDVQSDVLGLAADLQWKYHGFHLQSELITQQRRYADSTRFGETNAFFGQYVAPADNLNWGVYALVGYRFPWLGVMPYLLLQSFDAVDANSGFRYFVQSFFVGLNVRPIDVLVIKLEYSQSHFPDGFIVAGDTRLGQVQVAWAF